MSGDSNTMADRLATLQSAMRAAGMDVLAVVPGANMRYLAGLEIHMNERVAVAFFPAAGAPSMVLPTLETPRAKAQARFSMTFYSWDDADGPEGALSRCVADLGLAGKRIGVEYTAMRVLELRAIEAAAPATQAVDATPMIAELRMAKDDQELAAMRRAVAVVEAALSAAVAQIRAGMTEIELAAIWEREMRARGGEPSFGTNVASGPNAANPHHSNSDRAFQPGDFIIMDGGVWNDGYSSDITRTIALGQPSEQARQIYELVQAANAAGRMYARPEATGEEIDRATRKVIADGGYGQYFIHRTGHGLGLEVHEPPYIVAGSLEPLAPGTTFTIEPGVYVDGLCGVRIEDDMVITAEGAESLTSFERNLIIVNP
jgi:Xaa-Pro dipeptidase